MWQRASPQLFPFSVRASSRVLNIRVARFGKQVAKLTNCPSPVIVAFGHRSHAAVFQSGLLAVGIVVAFICDGCSAKGLKGAIAPLGESLYRTNMPWPSG